LSRLNILIRAITRSTTNLIATAKKAKKEGANTARSTFFATDHKSDCAFVVVFGTNKNLSEI
jgi:hypothetical protein